MPGEGCLDGDPPGLQVPDLPYHDDIGVLPEKCSQRRGKGHTETFTVRKMSGNIGVERIFPSASPFIEKVDINKYGRVRRARIFYFRELTGKKARISEKKF